MNPTANPFMKPPNFPLPFNPISITMSDIIPKESLYVNNLNTKVKCEELKTALYFLFCPFGEIANIICSNKSNLRGQAFIIFKSTASATQALKNLQNFIFYDKPIKINYTRERSDTMSKLDGTWMPRDKKKVDPTLKANDSLKKKVKIDEQAVEEPKKKNNKEEDIPPNNVLFVKNVPSFVTNEMLIELFKQYPGFKEVRLISQNNIAFVEYDDENQASIALTGLNGFKITANSAISVSYAKV